MTMTITLQQFITWRKAHDYRATVRTRAQMDAFTGKGQTNRNGKIFVHETTDYAPIVWDSETDNGRGATGYYADLITETGRDSRIDQLKWEIESLEGAE